MSFPLSPANNQVTLENGISYTYNASRGAWYRTPSTALSAITSNTFTVLNSIIFADGTSQTSAPTGIDQVARTTANTGATNITVLQGVNTTQNTNITAADTKAQAAFDAANTALGGDVIDSYARTIANTATSDISDINGTLLSIFDQTEVFVNVNATQNNRISILEGVDTWQNTSIFAVDTYATSAYGAANTNASNITAVDAKAQAAFNAANNASGGGEVIDAYARTTANSKFSSSGGTITGSVTITNNLTVDGNLSFTGNVTSVAVSGNSGQFFGDAANGFNALYAGIPVGYLIQPQITTQVTSDYDGYAGFNMQNINSGTNSSSDYFITADNGSSLDGYLDLGLAGSNYSYSGYSLLGPNDGYLFVSGNTSTGGGDLIIGTQLQNDIIFSVNGINTENEVMRVNSANNLVIKSTNASTNKTSGALQVAGGVGVQGDLYTNNLAGNVLALTASTASNTSVGYLGVPQRVVPMGGSDQLVLSDAGKQLYLIPTSNVYSIFIPSNATVPFPVGTAIVTVLTGPYTSNVAPLAGVTLRMAGNTSGANIARTLGSYSMASLLKVENDVWFISGAGVT